MDKKRTLRREYMDLTEADRAGTKGRELLAKIKAPTAILAKVGFTTGEKAKPIIGRK